jgi:4-hydroxy-tetrahydrodipicolinate reductase
MPLTNPLRIGLNGATGRMGLRITQLIAEAPDLRLDVALESSSNPRLGDDIGPLAGLEPLGVLLEDRLPLDRHPEVMIDFSVPEAALALVEVCVRRKLPLVIGTTGFSPDERRDLEDAANQIPLLIASNFSMAVNLLMKLTELTAQTLGDQADIEIVERHHHFKKDAPSGTALALADIAARAIGSDRFVHGRQGQVGQRPRGEIGLHALRTGDNPGEHTVVFGLMGESLELTHRALNRDGFARGALVAARFLATRPPGRYHMVDLLD